MKFSVKALKGQFHSKTLALAPRNRTGAGHGLTGGGNGAACGLFMQMTVDLALWVVLVTSSDDYENLTIMTGPRNVLDRVIAV